MFKILIPLLLVASPSAQAQLSRIFGFSNSSAVKVEWECGSFLATDSIQEIKIHLKERSGVVVAEYRPNIFSLEASTPLPADHRACIDSFIAKARDRITQKKDSDCGAPKNSREPICKHSTAALLEIVSASLAAQPVFNSESNQTPQISLEQPAISPPGKDLDKEDLKWVPYKYETPQETKDKEAAQIQSALEPFQCHGSSGLYNSSVNSMNNHPEILARHASGIAGSADKNCLKDLVNHFSASWPNYQLAIEKKPEFRKYCLENAASKLCKYYKEKWRNREVILKKLIEGLHGVPEVENSYICDQPYSDISEILKKLKDYEKPMVCRELENGQSKVVSFGGGDITSVGGKYALKKRSDGKGFDVTVGVNFKNTNDGVTPQDMLKRVQGCMKEVSPYMKGPKGDALNFEIVSAEKISELPRNQRPPINDISIEGKGHRSHSSGYASKIDCSTIVHEVMHLLGLCDEYSEKSNGACRVVPRTNSIMSHNTTAYKELVPHVETCHCTSDPKLEPAVPWASRVCSKVMNGTFVKTKSEELKKFYLMATFSEVTTPNFRNKYCKPSLELAPTNWETVSKNPVSAYLKSESSTQFIVVTRSLEDKRAMPVEEITCGCEDPTDANCLAAITEATVAIKKIPQTPRKTCPSYTTKYNVWQPKYQVGDLDGRNNTFDGSELKIAYTPLIDSLLAPNHYERIIGGACPEKAAKYNECAQWAYVTPGKSLWGSLKEKHGAVAPSCDNVPAHCKNDDEYLGAIK
ncbi:MAG TPA: hypothetical protein VNJ01_02040 [Bacteriovoracaceae bacterium]|nr:hypothetical protein [Bacteriovoracaceae bacterium]